MEAPSRREPAFDVESEAYTLFRSGMGFLETRHPGQAAMLLGQALRLEPWSNSIREALGRAEFAVGRLDRAADLFAVVVADAPDNDYAHYALARCLAEMGRGEEARAHLRLARALRPSSAVYCEPLPGID